jgi:DNA-binding winged helix-turn-helix (wHTH) protein
MSAVAIANLAEREETPTRDLRERLGSLVFATFRLDSSEARLWKGNCELRVRRKPFAILCYLAENPRRLITHDELVAAVWGRIAIGESVLRTHIHDLRRVLGEPLIETVPGRGYRFVANVSSDVQGCSVAGHNDGMNAASTRGAHIGGARPFALVGPHGPTDAVRTSELSYLRSSNANAHVLRQLAEAAATATNATLVIIVWGGEGTPTQLSASLAP